MGPGRIPGRGSFTDKRGYYNAQNLNAADNPIFQQPGVDREPSIMDTGTLLSQAFAGNVTSESSMRMLGWLDTDNDGVFDVLDVPHQLRATGKYNANTGQYRVLGEAMVGTLPNQNSSGLQSDITLNTVDELQFREDGGAWQMAAAFTDQHEVSFDVTVNVSLSASQIEFRTVTFGRPDDVTGVKPVITASEILTTSLNDPVAVLDPAAVAGVVFDDRDRDGAPGPLEAGIAGQEVLVLSGGEPLIEKGVEPDDFADLVVINETHPRRHSDGSGIRAAGRQRYVTHAAPGLDGQPSVCILPQPDDDFDRLAG